MKTEDSGFVLEWETAAADVRLYTEYRTTGNTLH